MTDPVPIRPAGLDDVSALRALVEKAYRGDTARAGWTHEADLLDDERTSDIELAGVIANPAQRLLVAEGSGGALTGTVTVSEAGPGLAYLGMLCVDPSGQASGLGRRLVAAAEAAAREAWGAHSVEMTVIARRAELIAWYERRGYARTGEIRPFPHPSDRPVDLPMVVLERRVD